MTRYLRELKRRRDLMTYLVTSGLKAQHRASLLGYFWWLLDPLLGVLIYYFIVVMLFKRSGGAHYAMYLVIGMIVWRWLSSTIQTASKSIVGQAGVITQVYLPKAIFPIGATLTQLFNFGFGLLIIAAFAVFFGVMPGWDLLWLPMIVATQLLFLLAVALPVAFYCVFIRDIEALVGHAMRIWFFASPVIWEEKLAANMPWLLAWNPMAHILRGYRDTLLDHRSPDFVTLTGIALVSMVTISATLYHYSRAEHRLVKVL